MFMDGNDIPVYITNKTMYTQKLAVDDEFEMTHYDDKSVYQGGFIWKVRSNGNLGLIWKGAGN
jgi:hypothetical protein